MPVSQNGWTGIVSGTDSRLVPLAWITGRVRAGDVHTIFDYLCRRFHHEVEPIRKDWSWGHYYRAIRGAKSLSNHASGTSVDLNAPEHPLGKRNTFNAAQRGTIRGILAELDGVVRWGGDYSGRPDDMHFEINAPAARVAEVARKITVGPATAVAGATSSVQEDIMDSRQESAVLGGLTRIIDLLTPGQEGVKFAGDIFSRLEALHGLPAAVAALPGKVWSAEVGRQGARRTMSQVLVSAEAQTSGVTRGGKVVSLRQEVADAKSLAQRAVAELEGQRIAIDALARAQGADPAQIREAVRAGVADALASIETTITIAQED